MVPSKICLIGRSDLAQAFQKQYPQHQYQWFARPDYDISKHTDCDNIIHDIGSPNVVLITAGIFESDAWTLLTTNFVGPSYLALKLHQKLTDSHIIVVSSLSSRWSSWPGVSATRLIYNTAKQATSNFVEGLYQSNLAGNRLTVIDPGRFQSRMNDHTGMDISNVVDTINYVMQSPPETNPINVQMAWHRPRTNQQGDV